MVRPVEVSPETILLSLQPRWAEAILCGTKTVEVRRRPMRLGAGSRAVLYASAPLSHVLGCCRLDAVHHGPATKLWQVFGPRTGLTRAAYLDYLAGAEATCIELSQARRCGPIPLGFAAPQSWMHLDASRSEHRELLDQIGEAP